jgi:hypothetical protein
MGYERIFELRSSILPYRRQEDDSARPGFRQGNAEAEDPMVMQHLNLIWQTPASITRPFEATSARTLIEALA